MLALAIPTGVAITVVNGQREMAILARDRTIGVLSAWSSDMIH